MWSVLVWDQGGNARGLLLAVAGGVWAAFPQFPPDGFKVFVGMAHSQAMWPQPWHQKHWRELGYFLFEVPPWLSLDHGHFVPGLDFWSLYHGWQIHCRLRWSVPGQFDHCGARVTRSVPVHPSSPTASLSGAIWGTGWAVSGPRIAKGISYSISNMFTDPMEEMVFEMLLPLSIGYPPRPLQPDLVEGPFQSCGEGGNLVMVALHHFVKILHKDIE